MYDLCGCDDGKIRGWMEHCRTTGVYAVDADVLGQMKSIFYGNWATEEETAAAIREMYGTEGYLCDPHTAVGVAVYKKYCQETGDIGTPAILVSTASPYKFAGSVLEALTGEPWTGMIFLIRWTLFLLPAAYRFPHPSPRCAIRRIGSAIRLR